jgi:peptidyl-prolyl cis-trans isomerase D
MLIPKIRKRLVIFIWAAIFIFIAFIFLQWGMDLASSKSGKVTNLNIVGKVNKTNLSFSDFERIYSQQLQQMRMQYGELTPEQKNLVSDRVFNQLIIDVLFQKMLNKLNIKTSDEEIMSIILNQPPNDILNDTSLFTDGKFDMNKYKSVIQDPRNAQFVNMYANQLKDIVPKQKLQNYIASFIVLQDNEIIRSLIENYEKVSIEYGLFPIENDTQFIKYSEEDGINYYNTNKDQFLIENKIDLSVISFQITPSIDDRDIAYTEIKEIYNSLKGGDDFEEKAKSVSQDPGSAKEGGKLGWLKKGMMVPEFEKIIFSQRKGVISKPFKTKYGWHIVKVYNTRRDSVNAGHILIRIVPSNETIFNIKDNADNFVRKAQIDGFENISKHNNMNIDTFEHIDIDQPVIGNYGKVFRLKEFLKNAKIGDISLPINAGSAFIVVSVTARDDSTFLSYDNVKDRIADSVKISIAETITKGRAIGAVKDINNRQGFARVIRNKNADYYKINDITMYSSIPGIGYNPKFNGVAFALNKGVISKPFRIDNNYVVIKLINRSQVTEDKMKNILTDFVLSVKSKKQQEIFSDWFSEIFENSNIEDYRYQYGY